MAAAMASVAAAMEGVAEAMEAEAATPVVTGAGDITTKSCVDRAKFAPTWQS